MRVGRRILEADGRNAGLEGPGSQQMEVDMWMVGAGGRLVEVGVGRQMLEAESQRMRSETPGTNDDAMSLSRLLVGTRSWIPCTRM